MLFGFGNARGPEQVPYVQEETSLPLVPGQLTMIRATVDHSRCMTAKAQLV